MEKQEFLESQELPEELASEAWEQADGDVEYAQELLSPVELTLKGLFRDEEADLYGLFLINWDLRHDELSNVRAAVVNSPFQDITIQDSEGKFFRQITNIEESQALLSGYTDSLKESLRNLVGGDNDYPESVLKDGREQFIDELNTELEESLELKKLEIEIDGSIRRRLETDGEEGEGTTEPEDEEVNVPSCDVQVTPVQGVSVEKLQPDDMIYVELGEIPEEWSKLRPVLEDLRDDSGLIPAQLTTKKHTDDGRMELQVQFGKKVFGTINCGRDVSLMVPDETLEKYDQKSAFNMEDVLTPSVLAISGVLVLVVVLMLILF
ncbi:MAG: hypothetical protein ABEK50_01435 [bacterium]